MLRDEAENYAQRLQAAGVEVKLKRYKGHFHCSMCAPCAPAPLGLALAQVPACRIFADVFPQAASECYGEISDFLHKAWQQP